MTTNNPTAWTPTGDGYKACPLCGQKASLAAEEPIRHRCVNGQPNAPRAYGLGCIHRGAEIGTQACRQCGRKGDSVAVFTCAKHGRCVESSFDGVPAMRKEGIAYCVHCPDMERRELTTDNTDDTDKRGDFKSSSVVSVPSVVPSSAIVVDHARGIAWQRDRTRTVEYGDAYFAKYESYRGTEIARRINAARVDLVRRHTASIDRPTPILDVGIGSGEFLEAWQAARGIGWGTDVNPVAIAWLNERGLLLATEKPVMVGAFTLWDTLEHMPEPDDWLRRNVRPGQLVFLSLPVIDDLDRITTWKHYWPDEHFWYFTDQGVRRFMADAGFELLESNDAETAAGRQDIRSYAFRRRWPGEAVLITGGLGDFLAVESLLTHDQRARIGTILLATRARQPIRSLLASHPRYRGVEVESIGRRGGVYHFAHEVERRSNRKLPPDVEDLSIARVFPRGPGSYTGSSFLQPDIRLADTSRFGLKASDGRAAVPASPYWVIHAYSRNERETPPRDFDADDWAAVLRLLEARGLTGVVLGTGDDPVPVSSRLIDLTNETTVPESLEILKGACGFAGCASALSVPAAQLFAADNLRIKGSNKHLWKNRALYYAPHTSWPFVVRKIEG